MATGKLMDIDQWRRARFAGEPPALTIVRKWCREGNISAKKIVGNWFIDLDAERNQTGNDLADEVLKTMGAACWRHDHAHAGHEVSSLTSMRATGITPTGIL